MSKFYEEFIRMDIDELKKFDKELKGEITIVISEKIDSKKVSKELSESDKRNINQMINKLSIKEIVNLISSNKQISKKEIMTPVLKNSLVRKSKFGGMSRGQWSTIADQMRGKSKPANNRYFYIGDEIQRAAATNGNPIPKKGIYLRKNKKISLVMVQNPTPSFTAKFKFFEYLDNEVPRSFEKNVLKEMNKAF